ncbi:uracil-DNA glycosylase-like protein [Hysterangium stoloniferum]|nr:uracil-DNA glycosylase-like protein [Hysterangium stoloniferum]
METSTNSFKQTISGFAFAANSSPSRRSGRLSISLASKLTSRVSDTEDFSSSLNSSPSKRKNVSQVIKADGSPKKKLKRGYAGPEKYAHLTGLTDHLAPDLDVVFCGINPGCMSAIKGHHFANPTNHFWRGLHGGGFTPRLLSPSEDATLPGLYSIGLTNLVSRVSAEQAELSKEEMKEAVPSLKAKILQHRPRIVCFVGKGIWLLVEAAFKKELTGRPENTILDDVSLESMKDHKEMKLEDFSQSLRAISSKSPRRRKAAVQTPKYGLQSYKLVFSDTEDIPKHDLIKNEETTPLLTTNQKETLFFMMPSTSGRVVSHQLDDKVKLFQELHDILERVKSNDFDTSKLIAMTFN